LAIGKRQPQVFAILGFDVDFQRHSAEDGEIHVAFGGDQPRLFRHQAVETADEVRREVLVPAGPRKDKRAIPRAEFRVDDGVRPLVRTGREPLGHAFADFRGTRARGQLSSFFTGAASAICKPMATTNAFPIMR
jgi:hypothetical protein